MTPRAAATRLVLPIAWALAWFAVAGGPVSEGGVDRLLWLSTGAILIGPVVMVALETVGIAAAALQIASVALIWLVAACTGGGGSPPGETGAVMAGLVATALAFRGTEKLVLGARGGGLIAVTAWCILWFGPFGLEALLAGTSDPELVVGLRDGVVEASPFSWMASLEGVDLFKHEGFYRWRNLLGEQPIGYPAPVPAAARLVGKALGALLVAAAIRGSFAMIRRYRGR